MLWQFTCDPDDFYSVRQKIEEMKYEIEYAGLEKIPLLASKIPDSWIDKMKVALQKLDEHEDVVKVHYNFDIDRWIRLKFI